jgi:hypothetical protein
LGRIGSLREAASAEEAVNRCMRCTKVGVIEHTVCLTSVKAGSVCSEGNDFRKCVSTSVSFKQGFHSDGKPNDSR